jgi:hypothetical protein
MLIAGKVGEATLSALVVAVKAVLMIARIVAQNGKTSH